MSTDGTIAITSFVFSGDSKMVAYTYGKSGSDWDKLKIRDVETGKDFSETLVGLKFSYTAWTRNNKGFFYNVGDQKCIWVISLKFKINSCLALP